MKPIEVAIKTESNLMIGGTPTTFEIGGIDQYTITDHNGWPYIPASSFKGALREIVRDQRDSTSGGGIAKLYADYLTKQKEVADTMLISDRTSYDQRFEKVLKDASAEYLFGIGGFNNTPKLMFQDFALPKDQDVSKLFSIDAKNTIDTTNGEKPIALPRTYKTARKGLTFTGFVRFYQLDQLGVDAPMLCKAFLKDCILLFNDGIYRIGNSKSRGYGCVHVDIIEKGK